MTQSLVKSHEKADRMILNTDNRVSSVFKNSCAIRPLMLKVIRFYPHLKNTVKYTEYLQVSYNKSKDWIMKIDREIISLEEWRSETGVRKTREINYLKKFRKNLKKIKKLCEDSSISYYNSLPGNKIPLEIRTHIISFISQVPLE